MKKSAIFVPHFSPELAFCLLVFRQQDESVYSRWVGYGSLFHVHAIHFCRDHSETDLSAEHDESARFISTQLVVSCGIPASGDHCHDIRRISPLIGYVTIRADSVIAAAILHDALNGTAMAPLLALKGGDVLEIGVMGFAGNLVLLCLDLLLVAVGRPVEWHKKWMERTLNSAAHP